MIRPARPSALPTLAGALVGILLSAALVVAAGSPASVPGPERLSNAAGDPVVAAIVDGAGRVTPAVADGAGDGWSETVTALGATAPTLVQPVVRRISAGRPFVRMAPMAIAAALAALLGALAEVGRLDPARAGRLRRLGAAPLGARAPPAPLSA